jgi:colanic acid biosynthesis glycosyl transferase WcaI
MNRKTENKHGEHDRNSETDTVLPGMLMLTLAFAPDSNSTAILLSEMARRLRHFGHDITVLTTTPHNNAALDALTSKLLKPKWGRLLLQSTYEGIPVYHARVRAKGSRIFVRFFDYIRFPVLATMAGICLCKPFDLVFACTPPPTLGLGAVIVAAFRRRPLIYNVQEIYPDIAVSLGVFKNRALIQLIEWLERLIYTRAEVVVVISECFRQKLLAKGVPEEKLRVIPNFIDVDFIQPLSRVNSFSVEHALINQFVVLYAGNLGLTLDLETIIGAADKLRLVQEICFLIVGDGVRREWFVESLERSGAMNVRLLPQQPWSEVPKIYASSDVCVIPQRPGTAYGTFPSKIYTIMAAGRPVIVSAESDTELASIVTHAQCGKVVPPGNPAALARAIMNFYEEREGLAEMGRRGRNFTVQHHSAQVVAQQYHKLAREIVSAGRARR